MSSERLQITVVQGSILEADAQVIVNAANSLGIMGGGVAGVIKRAAGHTEFLPTQRCAKIFPDRIACVLRRVYEPRG